MNLPELSSGDVIQFAFKTHNGDVERRRLIFRSIYYGVSEHFPDDPDWFIVGWCLDKCVRRAFKVSNIRGYEVIS